MRVVIAEDHTLVRIGMRLLLESIDDVQVVGDAADGEQALQLIEKTHPDCAIMDIGMPGLNGLEATRRASAHFPDTRILVLSMHSEEAYVQQALAAGAAGYLLKGAEKAELELALRTVARGEIYLSPAISRSIVAALGAGQVAKPDSSALSVLTERQREVLRLVAEGKSTKEAAALLGLSAKTVEAHRGAIMQRLRIRDLAGLVRLAIREGLVRGDR